MPDTINILNDLLNVEMGQTSISSKAHDGASTEVLSTRCIFAGHVLVISLFVSLCLVVAAFVLPVYDKYPCEVPGVL